MALVSSTQFGTAYEWGFQDSDAPVIANFVARAAELRHEPEAFSAATDGEAHTDSVTVSKKEKRMITGTFSGYIVAGFTPEDIAESFSWRGRFFIVRNVTEPRRKGEYVEASLEIVSFANVTGPA